MSSLMDYDLEFRIVRYKQFRNIAIIVLLFGIALIIVGGVMLGIGISKKHDADNMVCTTKSAQNCPSMAPCPTTTPFLISSTTTIQRQASSPLSTSVKPPDTTTINISPPTSPPPSPTTMPVTVSVPPLTCPPCTCPTIPATVLTTHTTHKVPVFTISQEPDPIRSTTIRTTTNTPPNYPLDPSYYPCKSYLIIAFEAASRISDDIFMTQKNFITKYLIHGHDQNWTKLERVAFVAFEQFHVKMQKFYHFHTLSELQNAISAVQKIDHKQGYKALFPALLDLAAHNTQNEYVNTIIFTSYNDGTEIYNEYEAARKLDINGRLIVVTTKSGIMTDFYPWTNNKANQIIYLDASSPAIQTAKIIEQFQCPTLNP